MNQAWRDIQRFVKELQRAGMTARYKRLARRRAYFCGTQYDHLRYDFDSYDTASTAWNDPYAGSSPSQQQPLRNRRPSIQTGMPQQIVKTFTRLLFSNDLRPSFVAEDEQTQEFLGKLATYPRFILALRELRDMGGSMGSAAIALSGVDGELLFDVIDTKHVAVEWKNEKLRIPRMVVQQYQTQTEAINGDGYPETVTKWYQRVWDETSETVRESLPVKSDREEIVWLEPTVVAHGLSRCPVVWVCNTPPEAGDIDGDADYPDLLFGAFDRVDYLFSTEARAFLGNMDPRMGIFNVETPINPDGGGYVNASGGYGPSGSGGVAWGTGNALKVDGDNADIRFIEPSFGGYPETNNFIKMVLQAIRSATSCLTFDPESAMASAPSGEALKRMLGPMLDRADEFRVVYGDAILQCAELIMEIHSKIAGGLKCFDGVAAGDTTGIGLEWPGFVRPSPQEVQLMVTTAVGAMAGRVVSRETAIKYAASAMGVDDIQMEIDAINERDEKTESDDSQEIKPPDSEEQDADEEADSEAE